MVDAVYRHWGTLEIKTNNPESIINYLINDKGYLESDITIIKSNIINLEYEIYPTMNHDRMLQEFINRLVDIDSTLIVNGRITLDYAYPDMEAEDYDPDKGDFVYMIVKDNIVTEDYE